MEWPILLHTDLVSHSDYGSKEMVWGTTSSASYIPNQQILMHKISL